MAQQTVVELIDDLDGGQAEETVGFAIDGVEYSIDLSRENAEKLRGILSEYVDHARRVGGRKQQRKAAKTPVKASGNGSGDKAYNQAVRDWARSQGHAISDRGRIPQNLMMQFKEANAS
ncbi:histone-like nucleoid-structuring protein Lsr2 [Goodfellowiella coeruleoviolacea]|uniref:Lsr2 protein n=1 Tax=Goodfellowiella coeruleoviolacea TaxID=334858 RepID=A0AAE3GHV4_9PSEU|nr:Lsr2 family protein [Goodfellowiella coeruleoviolacea]MCP2166423.1 Lsr2 protein [Goodfellowiella coeruleoviolacea]